MNNVRKEKRVWRTVQGDNLPLIYFRYSKEKIPQKTDLRFARCMRAEIYVHLHGDVVFFVGENMHKLNHGDILIYNKNEVHFSTINPDTTWERFVILFLPEHFDFINKLGSNLFSFYYNRPSYESNLISLPADQRKKMLDLLFKIDGHNSKNDFDDQLHCFMNFLRIAQIINDCYISPHDRDSYEKTPKIIKDIISYINSNFFENVTLESMARQSNISKSYLSAIFKKYLGISPYEYLLGVRLDHAKRLLGNGKSIADACFMSGFNDYSHFIQFFKKRVGMTPHKYCKSVSEETADNGLDTI